MRKTRTLHSDVDPHVHERTPQLFSRRFWRVLRCSPMVSNQKLSSTVSFALPQYSLAYGSIFTVLATPFAWTQWKKYFAVAFRNTLFEGPPVLQHGNGNSANSHMTFPSTFLDGLGMQVEGSCAVAVKKSPNLFIHDLMHAEIHADIGMCLSAFLT